MFTRSIRPSVLVAVLLCAALLSAGCNIEGLWAKRDSPEGPIAQTPVREASADPYEPFSVALADTEELDLVEKLLFHREQYQTALLGLRDYYHRRGYATKLGWAEFELKGVRGIRPFKYLLDAEVPPESLRPTERIKEADALYNRAMKLMREGGHRIPGFFRRDKMVEAAAVLDELIRRYPTSDKIDDAAFFQGEIHKEYLPGLEGIALEWYKRAWTWDPATPHPARFQAAVVHDFRLHDRDRALDLYHEVLTKETMDQTNVHFAARRIHQLSRDDRTARAGAG